MNKKTLTCVICPNGCELTVTAFFNDNNGLIIEGTECKRGLAWAEQEITNPKRTIASSILVKNGDLPLVSVKTDYPIPLKQIQEVMIEIKSLTIEAPVKIGQVLIKNTANTKTSIIATRNISRIDQY